MKRSISLTAALAMLTCAAPAMAQNEGRGHGREKSERSDRAAPGRGHAERGPQGRGEGRSHDRRAHEHRQFARAVERQDRRDVGPDRGRPHASDEREIARVVERVVGDKSVVYLRREPQRVLIQGCPPGLAKKNNGCLPPGQARQADRISYDPWRYDSLWSRGRDDYDYRYRDGYLYRLNSNGGLLGYLPLLGGALSLGQAWPTSYAYDPTPDYYDRYYGLGDRYDYRYADGVIYGLDPQTQAIRQVAALLTGQDWTVGRAMPGGYDVYNVPYAYRSRYPDGPDRWYRYDDGYVYQIDPTTRLVQAAIQLLT